MKREGSFNVGQIYMTNIKNNEAFNCFDTHPHGEPHSIHFVKEKLQNILVAFLMQISYQRKCFATFKKMQF